MLKPDSRTTYNIACVKVLTTPDDGKPIGCRLEPIHSSSNFRMSNREKPVTVAISANLIKR